MADEKLQMTKEELQNQYLNILMEEGYKPNVDSDGDVIFKKEGKNLYIDISDEIEFLRIVLPRFYQLIDSDRTKVLDIINEMNKTIKSVKTYIDEDNYVSISYEAFYSNPCDIKNVIERILGLLIFSISIFNERIEKSSEK